MPTVVTTTLSEKAAPCPATAGAANEPSRPSGSGTIRLPLIDAARTVFMLMVASSHHLAGGIWYIGGDFAVCAFFAISFSVLTFGTVDDAFLASPELRRDFVLKRIARLLPMYYANLAVNKVYWLALCAETLGPKVQSWWGVTSYASQLGPSSVYTALNWLASGCWIGGALNGEPSLLWMVQTLLWMYPMLPGALVREHAKLQRAGGRLDLPTLFWYSCLCYVWPCVIGAIYFTVFRGWHVHASAGMRFNLKFSAFPEWAHPSSLYAAIWAARESPVARVPMMLLTCRATLAVKGGWRPSVGLSRAVLAGFMVLMAVDVWPWWSSDSSSYFSIQHGQIDGNGRWKYWRPIEFLSQPFCALAAPFTIALHVDAHRIVDILASTPASRFLASLSSGSFSFYIWQSTSIMMVSAVAYNSPCVRAQLPTADLLTGMLPATLGVNAVLAAASLVFLERPSYRALVRLIEAYAPSRRYRYNPSQQSKELR